MNEKTQAQKDADSIEFVADMIEKGRLTGLGDSWVPHLRQIAGRLDAREKPAMMSACTCDQSGSPLRCAYNGPVHKSPDKRNGADHMCSHSLAHGWCVCPKYTGADRVTVTGVGWVYNGNGVMKNATELVPADWLAPLGLAGGTATAVAAAKTDSVAEPCICPPGAVSRSCRAVGFRSGIMHKDRE